MTWDHRGWPRRTAGGTPGGRTSPSAWTWAQQSATEEKIRPKTMMSYSTKDPPHVELEPPDAQGVQVLVQAVQQGTDDRHHLT